MATPFMKYMDDLQKAGYQHVGEYQVNVKHNRPNVCVFLTKAQKAQVDQIRKGLADAYEAKRAKQFPGVIHKWTGYAFIDTEVRAQFVDGQPQHAYINGVDLGPFTLSRINKTDYEYVIDRQTDFKHYLKTKKDFYLEVGWDHDGCVGGWVARVFDSKTGGNKLFDLEDLDLNAQ